MGMEYFPCYHSYLKCVDRLTDEEVGRLFRALIHYSATGERQDIGLRAAIAFDFIAEDIDRSKAAYSAKCTRNRENIMKRYATNDNELIRSNTNVYESYQEKEKEESKEKEDTPKGVVNKNRFTRPTVQEVADYCMERCNGVDADAFVSYYDSVGWKVGKNPMKDWKAAVRTWERRNKPKTMTSFFDVAEKMKGEGLA